MNINLSVQLYTIRWHNVCCFISKCLKFITLNNIVDPKQKSVNHTTCIFLTSCSHFTQKAILIDSFTLSSWCKTNQTKFFEISTFIARGVRGICYVVCFKLLCNKDIYIYLSGIMKSMMCKYVVLWTPIATTKCEIHFKTGVSCFISVCRYQRIDWYYKLWIRNDKFKIEHFLLHVIHVFMDIF